jgi:uncharacterized protein (TIGR03435 family)
LLSRFVQPPRVSAQSATADWEKAAGGKMQFDVVSVKENTSGAPPQTLFPLGPGNMYTPTGGRFSATDYPLFFYIAFAYKMTTAQMSALQHTLPGWVTSKRYDIEAHAPGNPGKDQMRLMIQSVLADRFKLAIRLETQQKPIFALVLDKPGKTGPQLRPYPDGAPCNPAAPTSSAAASGPPQMVDGMFPMICGGYAGMQPSVPGRFHVGARNVTIQIIADQFTGMANGVDRPVYDRTGLTGTYDFSLEFSPEVPPGANYQPDVNGPTFLEALKDQLGLKLESQTGPVDEYVIDHIEEPTPN